MNKFSAEEEGQVAASKFHLGHGLGVWPLE